MFTAKDAILTSLKNGNKKYMNLYVFLRMKY